MRNELLIADWVFKRAGAYFGIAICQHTTDRALTLLKPATLILAAFWSFGAFAADLPTPTLTPGDALNVTAADICNPSYAKAARNVSSSLKAAVYRSYGLTGNHTGYCAVDGGCEVDHLVSLELGGSNKITNLWPEPYAGTVWNAHTKDRLENYLHAEVCAGRVTLGSAQHDIALDWVAAYVRYLGEPTAAAPRR